MTKSKCVLWASIKIMISLLHIKILVMYDLYVAGNGTRNKNLRDITDLDRTIVSKNGEIIDGHRDEKILRTVLEGVVDSLDTLSAH